MKRLKLVLIGGGTGLSVLARGLKQFPIDITTIVTVADDGGSTGKIRNEMDIPAPGDIRNVISALSETEPVLKQLFQYRFKEDQVEGHSLGNLLIAAMTNITDDFGHAVKELSKILSIKGQVIPSTNSSVSLKAEMEDGELVYGESNIPKRNKRIKRVFLEPEDVEPMEEAIQAIEEADLIVLGPGSLYTSVISNLCVKGISEALVRSSAPKLYVTNVMTQSGETNHYTASDHLRALYEHVGEPFIDYVICGTQTYNEDVLERYRRENAEPVICEIEELEKSGIEVFTSQDLVEISSEHYVRHNTQVLSKMIYEIALRDTSTIEFKRKKDS
ncbi:YvcK family protein [Staphylococcus sp. SQ8-PEA]|uniref:Gluconeogenesis factor n=1 Tax=Staphylococcus marylandisciuri TaxID=2981529 RepID=A0ABT2QPE6_9STAP|nr:YvcK family protein [Staphylococcus marylandisciuri]MCU5745849.1 YvcK family protein [Staphylococcus marylandisciuri]